MALHLTPQSGPRYTKGYVCIDSYYLPMKTSFNREQIAPVGKRRQVVIPQDILETLKLQTGDFVAFAKQKNGVLIAPNRAVDLDDTLTAAEAKIVRRGEAQLKRGESKSWRDVKHALSR